MGRAPKSRALGVWMNGERVGTWRLPNRGEPQFTYEEGWFSSPAFRSLSLSLPATPHGPTLRGERVTAFFDNLLPDSDAIRRRLKSRFRAPSTDAFDLLFAVGRDCAGAVQVLPPDDPPRGFDTIEAEPLDEAALERLLIRTVAAPRAMGPAEEEDLRLSIAGAQEKTALLRHRGRWCRPLGATPTTHIVKLPLGRLGGALDLDLAESVENEWLCGKILDAYGIPVARSEMHLFGAQKCLVVERFDRKLHSSRRYWLRLPQEDFCQATGTPNFAKYEAEGGPGMVQISQMLAQSENREEDLHTFFKAQVLFWALRAIDGHAKNFSIFLLPGDRYRLAPLYDVLSAWPVIGNGPNRLAPQKVKMAMAWQGRNRHYAAESVRRRHMEETGRRCGIGRDAGKLIDELIAQTPQVVAQVSAQIPPGLPARVAECVLRGLETSARRLEQEPAGGERLHAT